MRLREERRLFITAILIAVGLAAARPALAGDAATVYVQIVPNVQGTASASCLLRSVLHRFQRIPDGAGIAKFDNVPPGKYAVECALSGYDSRRTELFVHGDDLELHVTLQLSLHEIGRVSAHESPVTTSRILTRGSPLGKLSQNLYDLMNGVGGANILTDASGSLLGVSLEGRDPRLTQYSFDGSRIPEPGALRALDADLLQSAQLDDSRSEVDFYTLAPTTFPEYTLRQTIGGFGGGATQLGVRGSTGSIGYVLQGKIRSQDSALDNATYADTSGLRYKHAGTLHSDGLLAKLSAPVSKTFTLTVETLLRGTTTLPIDTFFSGPLPSGSGPGNIINGSSVFTKAELEGDIGRWHAQFDATTIRTRQDFDYDHRVVDLQSLPLRNNERFRLDIVDASLIDFIAEGKTLNLSLAASRGSSEFSSSSLAFGSAYTSQQGVYRPDERLQATYVFRPNRDAQESLGLTAESRGAGHTAAYVEGNASVGSGLRRVFGTAGFGGRVVSPSESRAFDDPGAAQYDCDGNAIRSRVPNDAVTNVRERHLRLGGLLQGSRANLSVQVFDTLDAGLTVSNADTPLAAFSAGSLPAGYVDQLLAGFGSYGGCPGTAPAPAIYLLRDVSGLVVEYRGAQIAGSLKPSKSLTLQASLNAHLAILRSSSDALSAPDSPYIVGKQLPSVEPLDASFTADYGLHDQRTELIANAVFKPRNNGNGLPAYWLLTVGGTRKLSATSSVTVVATNALHRFVGLFSSPQYAVPVPTVSGGGLLLPAAPLIQPQIFVVLNMRVAHEQ